MPFAGLICYAQVPIYVLFFPWLAESPLQHDMPPSKCRQLSLKETRPWTPIPYRMTTVTTP